jgi:integrase
VREANAASPSIPTRLQRCAAGGRVRATSDLSGEPPGPTPVSSSLARMAFLFTQTPWSYWFERHVRSAGVPSIRFHDLRHTHASLALQAGVPAKVVSERLGHATVAFTLDVYSHVVPGLQEDAAQRVAALVDLG